MDKDECGPRGHCSRRAFIAGALAAPALIVELNSAFPGGAGPAATSGPVTAAKDEGHIPSPNGKLRFELIQSPQSRLSYRVTLGGSPVIETSALGIVVDNVDLGEGVYAGGGFVGRFSPVPNGPAESRR